MERDDLDIPEFMNYDRRRLEKNPNQRTVNLENHALRIQNINRPALTRMQNKYKIRKRRVVAGALIVTHLLAGILGAKISDKLEPTPVQPSIPTGYVLTEVTDRIESGDTIVDIADEYYDDGTYSGLYGNVGGYANAILEQNGLTSYSTVYPGEEITMPVVVDENNEFYIKIQVLKDAISVIEKTNLWVNYTLKAGEGPLDVAALASGTVDETYAIAEQIKDANKDARWWTGDTIIIMNPQLGQLKLDLQEMEKALQESLAGEQELESGKHY